MGLRHSADLGGPSDEPQADLRASFKKTQNDLGESARILANLKLTQNNLGEPQNDLGKSASFERSRLSGLPALV